MGGSSDGIETDSAAARTGAIGNLGSFKPRSPLAFFKELKQEGGEGDG